MQIQIKLTKTIEVDRIRAECGVRYWEDAKINGVEDSDGSLIPLRFGNAWCPTIMLENGRILDWPEGTKADIHYKVCDDGIYSLLTPDGNIAIQIGDYVPKIMCPGGSGYGDYIIMKIDGNGFIENWLPDLSPWMEIGE